MDPLRPYGILAAAFGLLFTLQSAYAVTLNPGDNIQTILNTNPAGTTYQLAAGMFRMQQVVPKNGDIFKGTLGPGGTRLTTLSGARLLTSFTRSGNYWVASGQTQEGAVHGVCLAAYPRCGNPEDLFFDDVSLLHVDSLANVGPGKYYFDYPSDKIYFWDDPTGHRVETSVARVAFSGSATGVTIQDLVVEKYAIQYQMGAIGDQFAPGTDWVIQNNDLRWNHGCGLRMGTRGKALNNLIHDNGEMGVSGGGTDILEENNEIYNNGRGGVDWGWEGGGQKFALTDRLTVRGNHSHDNLGPGLWTDIDNIHTVYENNYVHNNEGPGIFHEISYDAIIRNNTIKDNGPFVNGGWIWDAAIQISASQNVEIYNNTIEINTAKYANGISLLQQKRGTGAYGIYRVQNVYVHNNMTTVIGTNGRSAAGLVMDNSEAGDILASNNRFDYNAYYVPNLNSNIWTPNAWVNWAGWRSRGYDTNGCASTNNSCASPITNSPKCDVNHDSATNVSDVQIAVNQAIGLSPCSSDINGDGLCNVIDVQRVVNAALGGVCVSP